MAGIVYDLIEILDEEKECYEGLNTLASYTENAVINKNIEFLQEVVNSEEEFVGRLNYLENKRESIMNDMAIITGMKKENLTISMIIDKIGSDTEEGQTLLQLRAAIREQADALKKQSKLNKELLTHSLEIVDFMINAIGSMKGYANVGNYKGSDISNINMERQKSIFDAKQ